VTDSKFRDRVVSSDWSDWAVPPSDKTHAANRTSIKAIN